MAVREMSSQWRSTQTPLKPCPAKKVVTWRRIEEFPGNPSQEGAPALPPQCSLPTQALGLKLMLAQFSEGRKYQRIVHLKTVDLIFDKFKERKREEEEEGDERKRKGGRRERREWRRAKGKESCGGKKGEREG